MISSKSNFDLQSALAIVSNRGASIVLSFIEQAQNAGGLLQTFENLAQLFHNCRMSWKIVFVEITGRFVENH